MRATRSGDVLFGPDFRATSAIGSPASGTTSCHAWQVTNHNVPMPTTLSVGVWCSLEVYLYFFVGAVEVNCQILLFIQMFYWYIYNNVSPSCFKMWFCSVYVNFILPMQTTYLGSVIWICLSSRSAASRECNGRLTLLSTPSLVNL